MGFLPTGVHLIGYSRTKMDNDEFQKRSTSYIKTNDDPDIQQKLEQFKAVSSYVSGPYDQDSGFQALEEAIKKIEETYQSKDRTNRLFYFALPPSVFIPVAQGLKKNCYHPSGNNRVIVEKPFGKDLQSYRDLSVAVKKEWAEHETFRIDHYLGKEMVKNILVLRFANIATSSFWDKHFVSNVQISFKEPFGTEGRGGYFDEFGIIRDIQQNRKLFGDNGSTR